MKDNLSENILANNNLMRDMLEGVIIIEKNGTIAMMNNSAEKMFLWNSEKVIGGRLGDILMTDTNASENEEFVDLILESVYDPENPHRILTEYNNGEKILKLHITTSALREEGNTIGVIIVCSDMTELFGVKKTFGRFLSEDIVETILSTPEGLEVGGSKKEITILISDLRGFTALCEHMDGNDMIKSLNHCFGIMSDIIEKYNGTIIEFLGDGILSIFNGPKQDDLHAEHAVAAALEMQSAMDKVKDWNRGEGYLSYEMGIGINTGIAIVGNIGSESRSRYGVVGAPVNLCGRIESYATGGDIYISHYTKSRILSKLQIDEKMEVFPKGLKEPLTIYKITGIQGRYNINIEQKKGILRSPEKNTECFFEVIRDKHIEDKIITGEISKISNDEAEIIVKENTDLEVFDDLQINIGDNLYGKVREINGESIKVSFTSKPKVFDEWLEQLF